MTKEQLLEQAKPILFNTDMVQAILENRKSCTRRGAKGIHESDLGKPHLYFDVRKVRGLLTKEKVIQKKAPYHPGDILYVRETWQDLCLPVKRGKQPHDYAYKASNDDNNIKWRPSIHMPKTAARIFLKVTDVRIERLQDITEEQAKLEGAIDNRGHIHSYDNEYDRIYSAREHFAMIWNATIKKAEQSSYSWEANPWVWVIEFERVIPE